ncbi:nicotinamide riboside transporter PnuC [Actinocorallia lasiicapitis]
MLHSLVGPLTEPAFTLGGTPTTWSELIGFVTGAVCVWLVARQHLWNWPIGILSVLMYLLVLSDYGLYADAGLQIVYLALNAYGWWAWLHGGVNRTPEVVRRTTRAEWAGLAVGLVAGTAAIHTILTTWTDSAVPFWDALTTSLSLAATYGQCRKLVESWWLWILADLIYIPLFAHKQLYLTSALYLLFLGLCFVGLTSWRADLRTRTLVAA